MVFITWIGVYVVGSAAADGTGYLDTNTSVVVVVLGLMVLVFAVWNLVLGLRLTARLNAKETSVRDE
jgi:sorbitol-specific phosphotransferase system component IIC